MGKNDNAKMVLYNGRESSIGEIARSDESHKKAGKAILKGQVTKMKMNAKQCSEYDRLVSNEKVFCITMLDCNGNCMIIKSQDS